MDCMEVVLENLDKYTTDGLKELIDMAKDEIKKRIHKKEVWKWSMNA